MTTSVEEWLELESDPGLFTMLLENIGVKGVQVEDVYDLTEEIKEDVFGFVFLFKWRDESKKNKRCQSNTMNVTSDITKSSVTTNGESKNIVYETDVDKLNEIYFAHQVIPNSCATNALLSVLMNCSDQISLGPILTSFKDNTISMSPEKRGAALGNMPELADAHNKRARYLRSESQNNYHNVASSLSSPAMRMVCNENDPEADETYHFVSYIKIGGGLYELDGLQPYPIKHGTITVNNWTKPCLNIIRNRMQQKSEHFSLMAVVRDRRKVLAEQLTVLNKNRNILQQALFQMDQENGNQLKKDISIDNLDDNGQKSICDSNAIEISSNNSDSSNKGNNNRRRTSNRVSLRNQRKMDMLKKDVEHNNSEELHLFEVPVVVVKNEERLNDIIPSLDILKPISIDISSINSAPSDQASSDNLTNSSSSGKGNRNSSKYPTRSSTKRDTIASNSLACSRSVASPSHYHEPEMNITEFKFPTFSPDQLRHLLQVVDDTIKSCKSRMSDEIEKRNKYVTDDIRRSFNYDDFIHAFLFALKKQGLLEQLLEQQMISKKATKRTYRSSSTCKRIKLMANQDSKMSNKSISVRRGGKQKN